VRPDLVHLVSMKPVIWGGIAARVLGIAAVAAAVTGLGYLFIRQGHAAELQRAVLVRLYRLALGHPNLRVIFQNDDDRDEFLSRRMVDAGKVVMIRGCGVDLARFAPSPEPAGPPVVMFPARLIGDKGVGEFLAAVAALKPRHPAARFVLVGRTDPLNPTAMRDADIQALADRGLVEWWGFSTDMPATLARAAIIVLPSYREGLPRGLIEAAACRRAIVTTDVPGCRDVVRHEVNGLLVPARDGAATAAAIARLLDDPALRDRLATAGRAIAESEFSVEGFVERSLAAYLSMAPRQ
jgi:glycosyltransferase involved in cell wall biosynthesis